MPDYDFTILGDLPLLVFARCHEEASNWTI